MWFIQLCWQVVIYIIFFNTKCKINKYHVPRKVRGVFSLEYKAYLSTELFRAITSYPDQHS